MDDLAICCFLPFAAICVIGITAFALQAACVFVNVPPITFGQALAMSLLDVFFSKMGESILLVCMKQIYSPKQIPFEVLSAGAAVAILGGLALSGWLYSEFFEYVTFRKGVIIAVVANIVQAFLFGVLLGIALLGGWALR